MLSGDDFVFYTNIFYAKQPRRTFEQINILAENQVNTNLLDYGNKGMYDTMLFIKKMGAKFCGAGWNLDGARKPAVVVQGTN